MSRVEETMPEIATSVGRVDLSLEVSFTEVLRIIQQARQRCMQAVNIELIEHYWQIGEYLHHKIKADGWKKLTVVDLSAFIARHQPGVQGYSPQNLWRMRQFYEMYREDTRLSPLVRVLPWSHNLLIMSQCRSDEEREFYLRMAVRDFKLDLLFFHRGLNALVAIELKVGPFEPEHLGKLDFYLEALDRDVRKAHERPSIGLLLCASKDSEVVEYALSRSLSPALIAEYQTRLPDKKLLEAKLHEFYALNARDGEENETKPVRARQKGSKR